MQINGYNLGNTWEKGNHFDIAHGLQEGTGTPVTLRLYAERLSQQQSFCQHLQQAVKPLLQFRFGIMAALLDANSTQNSCYLVSEYFPCQTHKARRQAPQLNVNEALQLALKISATLDLLYAHGLSHGGIRQENLYFPDQGEIQLGLPAFHLQLGLSNSAALDQDYQALGRMLHHCLFQSPIESDLCQLPREPRLLPVLQNLVNPLPDQPIRSAQVLHQQLQDAGYHVEACSYQAMPLTHPESINNNPIRVGKPVALAASVLIAAIVGLQFWEPQQSSGPDQDLQEAIALELGHEERTPAPQKSLVAERLDEAKAFIAEDKLGAALIALSQLLSEQADHPVALALQQQIKQEMDLRAELERIDQLIANDQRISAKGDSALQRLQRLEQTGLSDDQRIQQRISNIARHYEENATQAHSQQRWQEALKHVALAQQADPKNTALTRLKQTIEQDQKNAAQQRLLAQQQRQQQQREEQQRIALLEQQRAREQAREQQRNNLVEAIQLRLAPQGLSQGSLQSARSLLQQLQSLDQNNQDSEDQRIEIASAYHLLAQQQDQSGNRQQARVTANLGIQFDARNLPLLTLLSQWQEEDRRLAEQLEAEQREATQRAEATTPQTTPAIATETAPTPTKVQSSLPLIGTF